MKKDTFTMINNRTNESYEFPILDAVVFGEIRLLCYISHHDNHKTNIPRNNKT